MRTEKRLLLGASAFLSLLVLGHQASSDPAQTAAVEPRTYTYREVGDQALQAYVFAPEGHSSSARANAVLLFHGGGWSAGEPAWTFAAARRFADWGLVAIAIQYRLSAGDVTPIEALDDVCAAFQWVRQQSAQLGLSGRIVGYGVSAGGHLVAAAATLGCPGGSRGPDALLLWSPAVAVGGDQWFGKKLLGRASAADYSPVEHVGSTTPPTCIVQGAKDTLTPLSGAEEFCRRLTAAGGVCELNTYPGVGHLLTRNLANQESDFDPDPTARADGIEKQRLFLLEHGFLPAQPQSKGAK